MFFWVEQKAFRKDFHGFSMVFQCCLARMLLETHVERWFSSAEALEDALELFKEVDFDGSGWTSNAFDCLTQAFICKAGAYNS